MLDRERNHQWWTDRKLAEVDTAARSWVLHTTGLSQVAQAPGWNLDPTTVRQTVLMAAAWASA